MFQWDLQEEVKLNSSPGPLAVFPDGKIAVYTPEKIKVYATDDEQKYGNNCLYSLQTITGCNDVALTYGNKLFASTGDNQVTISTISSVSLKVHDQYSCNNDNCFGGRTRSSFPSIPRLIMKKHRGGSNTSICVAAYPTLNSVYYYCHDHYSLVMLDLPLSYHSSKDLIRLIEPSFLDLGVHGKLLFGNSHKIHVAAFEDIEPTNAGESFPPPATWLFVKARFASAPKANPDIYAICQNDLAWYNYAVYKFVWQESTRGEMCYTATSCIITGLDKPCDIQVTTEGDVVCSESGKNRVVVYRVKSVP